MESCKRKSLFIFIFLILKLVIYNYLVNNSEGWIDMFILTEITEDKNKRFSSSVHLFFFIAFSHSSAHGHRTQQWQSANVEWLGPRVLTLGMGKYHGLHSSKT